VTLSKLVNSTQPKLELTIKLGIIHLLSKLKASIVSFIIPRDLQNLILLALAHLSSYLVDLDLLPKTHFKHLRQALI
jgi:hypothetical protein